MYCLGLNDANISFAFLKFSSSLTLTLACLTNKVNINKFITTISTLSIHHNVQPVDVHGNVSLNVNDEESNIGNTMSAVILKSATRI